MIKVGLVGVGGTVSIARMHLKAYLKDPRVSLVAIYNRSQAKAKKLVEEFILDAKVCNSYEELLDLVDVVDICTPNYTHYEFAYKAIAKDKHLLLEKPMTVSLEEAESLRKIAASSKRVQMLGFSYRYATVVEEMKKIISENFQNIYTVNCLFGGKRLSNPEVSLEWRMLKSLSGSGAWGDFGSHLLDLIHYLTEEEFTEAIKFSQTFIKERKAGESTGFVENDDATAVILRSNKMIGTFLVSRVGAPEMNIQIAGDGGLVKASMENPNRLEFHPKIIGGPYTGEVIIKEYREDNFLWIKRQIKHFIDCIIEQGKGYATIEDGYYVQKLLQTAETNLV